MYWVLYVPNVITNEYATLHKSGQARSCTSNKQTPTLNGKTHVKVCVCIVFFFFNFSFTYVDNTGQHGHFAHQAPLEAEASPEEVF